MADPGDLFRMCIISYNIKHKANPYWAIPLSHGTFRYHRGQSHVMYGGLDRTFRYCIFKNVPTFNRSMSNTDTGSSLATCDQMLLCCLSDAKRTPYQQLSCTSVLLAYHTNTQLCFGGCYHPERASVVGRSPPLPGIQCMTLRSAASRQPPAC